jgi:hypothetical protein
MDATAPLDDDAATPTADARPPATESGFPSPDAAPLPVDTGVLLPPPAARPPEPPPDASDLVNALAGERPDLLEGSCVAQGGTNAFLFELTRRAHMRDPRWGLVLREGALLQDRLGYFWGDGMAEGHPETYVVDVIQRHCARAGIDAPAAPGWLDDTAAGGTWTLRPLDEGDPRPPAPPADAGPAAPPPLPDEFGVVQALAAERPDLLAASCRDQGGHNEFLFEAVRRLRVRDPRWGLNWKRGNVGDLSQDAVDYFYAEGEPEGRTEVYIVDIIGGHCGPNPQPAFIDQTEATRAGGTIGRWTLAPLP